MKPKAPSQCPLPRVLALLAAAALLAPVPCIFAQTATAAAPANDALASAPQTGRPRFFELHESYLARAKAGPVGLLFLGDSITYGWSKYPEIWERNFGRYQPANFGIGGDRTQHILWRIEQGTLDGIDPRVLVLMIGTNNSGSHSAAQILAAQEWILGKIREKLPGTRILLLEIFPRGPRPREGEPAERARADAAKRMAVINAVNAGMRKFADGGRVRVLNINQQFLGPDGKIPETLMYDQLHLTEEGYRRWAEAIRPVIEEMMK